MDRPELPQICIDRFKILIGEQWGEEVWSFGVAFEQMDMDIANEDMAYL